MKGFAIVFVLLTVFIFGQRLSAQNPSAVIRELTGTVEVKRAGSENWVTARAGDSIALSSVISTGFRSTAILSAGSSTITVRPLTRLSIDELMNQDNTETVNLTLNTGRIRADVVSPAGNRASFTVQAPAASASVRGTSFEMDTAGIRVIEGEVSYSASASSKSVILTTGQQARINTATGELILPMAAAETDGSLAALPGQGGSGSDTARFEFSAGFLEVDVILVEQ
jgi:hypothetical protein